MSGTKTDEEILEERTNLRINRMREFGLKKCHRCSEYVEYDNYSAKSSHHGTKYFCQRHAEKF